jgi:hypothetical protein
MHFPSRMRHFRKHASSSLPLHDLHKSVHYSTRQYPEFTSGLRWRWRSAEKMHHNDISDHFILKYNKWRTSVLHKIMLLRVACSNFPSLIYCVNTACRFHFFTYMALSIRKKISKLSELYFYVYFRMAAQGASQCSQKHAAYRDGYFSHSKETSLIITQSKLLWLGSILPILRRVCCD